MFDKVYLLARETPRHEHKGLLIRCEIYQLIFDLRHRVSQEHWETAECLAFYLFEKLVGSFSSSAVKQIAIVYVFSVFYNFMHLRTEIVWTFSNSHVFHLRCSVSSFLSSTVFSSCKCMFVGGRLARVKFARVSCCEFYLCHFLIHLD